MASLLLTTAFIFLFCPTALRSEAGKFFVKLSLTFDLLAVSLIVPVRSVRLTNVTFPFWTPTLEETFLS